MLSYVYGCASCCERNSRRSSLFGRMAEAMGHALQRARGNLVAENPAWNHPPLGALSLRS
jgi:hypothetical protein